jgi:hypothetical protein
MIAFEHIFVYYFALKYLMFYAAPLSPLLSHLEWRDEYRYRCVWYGRECVSVFATANS